MSTTGLQAGRPTGRTADHVRAVMSDIDEEKRLNVIMPSAEYFALKEYALKNRMTVSDVVRNALKQVVKS